MRQRLTDNPIIALEMRSRRRHYLFQSEYGKTELFPLLFYAITFGLALIFYLWVVAASLFGSNLEPFMNSIEGEFAWFIFGLLGLVQVLALIFRGNNLGSALIVQEQHRWDLMVLTGISTKQLAWGKAWIGMNRLKLEILHTAMIRVAMSLGLGLLAVDSSTSFYSDNLTVGAPSLPALLLLPILSLGYTVLVTALSLASGLLISARSTQMSRAVAGGGCSLILVWVGLVIAIVGGAIPVVILAISYQNALTEWLAGFYAGVVTSLLDAGSIMLVLLAHYQTSLPDVPNIQPPVRFEGLPSIALASLLAFMIYAGLTLLLMRLTEISLRQRGVSASR